MIRRARLRLTLWYSGALLLLLLILSTVTYTALTRTLRTELEDGISSAVGQWLDVPRRLPLARPPDPRGLAPGPGPRAGMPVPGVPTASAPAEGPPSSSATPAATVPAGTPAGPRGSGGLLRPDSRLFPLVDESGDTSIGSTSDVFLLAYRADGSLAVNQRRVDDEHITESDALQSALSGRAAWETVEDDGVRLRILARPIVVGDRVEGAVVGARNLDEYDRQVRAMLTVLAMVAIGGGLLSLGGAYLFAGHALQPLEEAYQRQRSFVADASHELRSPLAVIRASADLLLREPLDAPQRESVEEIRDVTQEAATLVDDLLELARAEEAAAGPASADAAAEVGAAIEQMRAMLERRDHAIEAVLAPVQASAGGAEVRRIVRALLENVAAHTPEGTAVRVEVTERDGHAVIAVEDHGPGVPDGHEEAIFDRFARLDEARTPGTGHGAGLGLAIVRSLAERRGGSVGASRPAEGGLRVEVSLPLAR